MEGCYTTTPSDLSDGRGVAARREGNIPAAAGKYSSSSSPAIGIQSVVVTLAMRSGWGVLSRMAWLFALRDSSSTFNSSCGTRSRRKQMRRRSSEG